MIKIQETSKIITKTVEALSTAADLSQITKIVAETARVLSKADGTTFVLREDEKCFYADEDAISPLWKGKRFPMEACISGWCMQNREIVCIPDIYKDERIPHNAYRPTFVKSLCMVPIRSASPIGAIGNYWSDGYQPSSEEIKNLQILANCASVAVENWQLKKAIKRRNEEKNALNVRHSELEVALHTLVHDLRNPISSMLVFTELLQKHIGENMDERAASYLESINRTGTRVHQTIGQMLALYKLTSKELSKQRTDLSIIGMEISDQLRIQETARCLDIKVQSPMIAYADPLLIRLVMENLFVNAYKFTATRERSEIEFGRLEDAEKKSEQIFFVKDNGLGFDEKDAHKLFKPMACLHDAGFSGTGLGLASVSQIIQAHGGSVRAEGRLDQGAAFYFSLPKMKINMEATSA